MGNCQYRDNDFMNQRGQLYITCEYVGWHVGNSKVGFVVPIKNNKLSKSRQLFQNPLQIFPSSRTFACSTHWGQQGLGAQST